MRCIQDICRILYLRISETQKLLFKIINTLLNKKKQSLLPDHSSGSELAATFNTHFIDKVTLIQQSLEELDHTPKILLLWKKDDTKLDCVILIIFRKKY